MAEQRPGRAGPLPEEEVGNMAQIVSPAVGGLRVRAGARRIQILFWATENGRNRKRIRTGCRR